MALAGRGRTFSGHQNHRPIRAAIDGVMNDRTIRVSNSSPSPIVVPIWPSTRRLLKANEPIVAANTSPAAVTTALVAIARMMPGCSGPAWISSLSRISATGCIRTEREQQDDGQRQHDPVQLDAEEPSTPTPTAPNEAPNDSADGADDHQRRNQARKDEHHDQQDQAQRRDTGDQQVVLAPS